MTIQLQVLFRLFQKLNHGVIILDKDFEILEWNAWIENASRIPQKEALGKKIYSVFPTLEKNLRLKTALEWAVKFRKYAIISEKLTKLSFPLFGDDGVPLTQKITIIPESVDGTNYTFVEIFDSTSYLNRELVCRKQTIDLKGAQVKIVESSKLAALGEMAGGIAHEINTPLGAIILRCYQAEKILKESPPEVEKAVEIISKIREVGHKIETIVRGLRNFARSGDEEPSREENLSEIVKDSLALCSARFENSCIAISCEEIPLDMTAFCRRVQVSQVVINILSNAHHILKDKEGDKFVKLSARIKDKKVQLLIENNGPVIPPEMKFKIFQPFFTTKKIGEGTGLGLSISRSLVEAQGGHLDLDSDSPLTRFIITLSSKKL